MFRSMEKSEFQLVYQIMKESFPESERRPMEAQKKLLGEKDYHVAVCEQNGLLGGFLASWQLKDFRFIEHFAVDPQLRNHGLGWRMLRTFLQADSAQTVLEVEPPQTELAKRRIQFYKRNGFYLNSYSYHQPPMADGQKPIPLMIMSSGKALNPQEFQRFRGEVYKKVYRVAPNDLNPG